MSWVINATPWPLYRRERPGTHCIGGRSGRVRKISPLPGFDFWTVQPVASCYTDCIHIRAPITGVNKAVMMALDDVLLHLRSFVLWIWSRIQKRTHLDLFPTSIARLGRLYCVGSTRRGV